MDYNAIIAKPKHHAYIIFTTNPNVSTSQEVIHYNLNKAISIGDVQKIQEYANADIGTTKRKICITASGITIPAQHALLKTFEELQRNVYFFIFVTPGTTVLPTLVSRCYIVESLDDLNAVEKLETFFTASPARRITYLDTIWSKGEETRTAGVLAFLQGCELYAHHYITQKKKRKMIQRVMSNIFQARSALNSGIFSKLTLQLFAFV